MKKYLIICMLCFMASKTFAYDIAVKNSDSITIYYNYINEGKELEVVPERSDISYNSGNGSYYGEVKIPEEVVYMNRTRKVTSIGGIAFAECSSLTSIIIPNSVTTINPRAFFNSKNLHSIQLPNNLERLEEGAFQNCFSLKTINIPAKITNIKDYLFFNCHNLEKVTISDNITSIGEFAFYNCNSLTSFILPKSLNSIGCYAFCCCKSLESVVIGNNITIIEHDTFADCTSLTSLVIGDNVEEIGYEAFMGCKGLASVTIPNSIKKIGRWAFYGWDLPIVISKIDNPFIINGKSDPENRTFSLNTFNNATLYVPKGTKDKYMATNGWKDFLYIEEGDGIYNSISTVRDNSAVVQTNGRVISISGVDDGQKINVYELNGTPIGSCISTNGKADIYTDLTYDSIVIVKIGDISIKVFVKM